MRKKVVIRRKKINKMKIDEIKEKMEKLSNQKSSMYYKALNARLKELVNERSLFSEYRSN